MQATEMPRINHTTSGQQGQGKTYEELLKENGELLQEVSKLKDLLDQERNASRDSRIIALTHKLQDTKQLLLKKKLLALKNKELKRQLEETKESQANIVADYLVLDRRLNVELDVLRKKMANDLIRVQENATKRENSLVGEIQEIKIQLDRQISTERNADDLQRELEETREAHKYMITAYKSLGRKLKGELEDLRQKTSEEMSSLQQNASERESSLLREMEEIKNKLDRQISLNIELSNQIKATSNLPNTSTSKVVEESKDQEDKLSMEEAPIIEAVTLPEEEPQIPKEELCVAPASTQEAPIEPIMEEMPTTERTTQAQDPDAPRRPSLLKRARHFLGLRKPQGWKKRRMD